MSTKELNSVVESCELEAVASNIDDVGFVIKHAKILGPTSINGRVYPVETLRKAVPLYEGAPVYQGHPTDATKSRSGSYGEGMGLIRNPVVEGDSMFGDFHLNPEHPRAKQALWDAKNSKKVGFSHHADLLTVQRGGKAVVESIDRVHSVDLVNRPATTKSFFESENPVKKTIKQVLESIAKDSVTGDTLRMRTVLEDMMTGDATVGALPVDAPEGGSSDDTIKAAFRSAIVAKFDDESLDTKATLAAMKDIMNAYEKLTGKADKGAAKPGDTTPADAAKTESVEAKLARLERTEEVRTVAEAAGIKLEPMHLKAAVALESVEDRAAFVKSLPKPVAQPAKGGASRPLSSPGVTESDNSGANVPKAGKPVDTISFLRGHGG